MTETNPSFLADVSTESTTHRVALERTHIAGTGPRYRVHHAGRVLIESTRDPEFDTCRALKALGLTGIVETFGYPGGKTCRMRLDIETAAGLRTAEGSSTRLQTVKFTEYPDGAHGVDDQ